MKLAKSWILQNFDKRIQGNLFGAKFCVNKSYKTFLFESQEHYLSFYKFLLEKTKINKKRPGLAHFLKNEH